MTLPYREYRRLIEEWKPGKWQTLDDLRECIKKSGCLHDDDLVDDRGNPHWYHQLDNCLMGWKRPSTRSGCYDLSWNQENSTYRVEYYPDSEVEYFVKPFCLDPDDDPKLSYENDGEGTVYLITNPLFENWVKIGCSKNLEVREQSYQTYSPSKYQVIAYTIFDKCYELEKEIHNKVLHPNPSFESVREWHNISTKNAIHLILQKFPDLNFVYRHDEEKSIFDY